MFDFDDIEQVEPSPPPKSETRPALTSVKAIQEQVQSIIKTVSPRKCNSDIWDHSELKFEVKDGVATMTLNSLAKFNSMTTGMMDAMLDALVELHEREGDIRVLIVRAMGAKFCMGLDPSSGASDQTPTEEDIMNANMHSARMYFLFATLPQFVIGAIQGPAMGGGCGLICTFDLCIGAKVDDQKRENVLKFSEVLYGMVCISWPYLVARLGNKSKMAILQAKEVKFDEAKELGILHEVAENKAGMEKKIQEAVGRMQSCGGGSVAHAKRYVYSIQGTLPSAEFIEYTAKMTTQAMSSPERLEASEAFVKQAKPSWAERELKI